MTRGRGLSRGYSRPYKWALFSPERVVFGGPYYLRKWASRFLMVTIIEEHQIPSVTPVPYACAQPCHPGSGSHGLITLLHKALNEVYWWVLVGNSWPFAWLCHAYESYGAAFHDCHNQDDMAVRMRKVLAIPRRWCSMLLAVTVCQCIGYRLYWSQSTVYPFCFSETMWKLIQFDF